MLDFAEAVPGVGLRLSPKNVAY